MAQVRTKRGSALHVVGCSESEQLMQGEYCRCYFAPDTSRTVYVLQKDTLSDKSESVWLVAGSAGGLWHGIPGEGKVRAGLAALVPKPPQFRGTCWSALPPPHDNTSKTASMQAQLHLLLSC